MNFVSSLHFPRVVGRFIGLDVKGPFVGVEEGIFEGEWDGRYVGISEGADEGVRVGLEVGALLQIPQLSIQATKILP